MGHDQPRRGGGRGCLSCGSEEALTWPEIHVLTSLWLQCDEQAKGGEEGRTELPSGGHCSSAGCTRKVTKVRHDCQMAKTQT